MAPAYDIQQYLLDRANLHDAVTKLTLCYDTKSAEGLESLYTPECVIDFTPLFGGEPLKTTSKEWAGNVLQLVQGFDSTQHVLTGIVIQLPQPTPGSARPDKCSVIANVNGHFLRKGAEGGQMMHNGGRYELNMVRLSELEDKGENPWKVTLHKTIPLWVDGNSELNHGRRAFVATELVGGQE